MELWCRISTRGNWSRGKGHLHQSRMEGKEERENWNREVDLGKKWMDGVMTSNKNRSHFNNIYHTQKSMNCRLLRTRELTFCHNNNMKWNWILILWHGTVWRVTCWCLVSFPTSYKSTGIKFLKPITITNSLKIYPLTKKTLQLQINVLKPSTVVDD